MTMVQSSIRAEVASTPRGPVEFAESGSGMPVLYFHGSGAANDLVFAVEHDLLAAGFRLIVPNRPGYEGTPLSCGTSSADCADLAVQLLDHLGIEAAAIMGCSGGGLFAARFAERHPRRTLCLVLGCAQTHRWDAPVWLPEHSRWTYPFTIRPFCRKLLLTAYRWQLKFATPARLLRLEAGRRMEEAQSDAAAIEFSRITLNAMKRCQRCPAGFHNDFEILVGEELLQPGSVKCPTLVIHDALDPMAPVEHRDWTIACVSHAELCDIHAFGHLIWFGPGAQAMYRRRAEFLRRYARDRFNHQSR
jgi:pimeloyl-ACP methyl ester carboxylesterase